jgi:hypothetical protein
MEYLFCERLFGYVLLIEKSAVGKLKKKKCSRKITTEKVQHEKCGMKTGSESEVEKVRQKNHSRKILGS